MPIVDVEENINKITLNIEAMTQEIYRLQGMLNTFKGFQKGGLKTIELPNDPTQESAEELESIQEKPE